MFKVTSNTHNISSVNSDNSNIPLTGKLVGINKPSENVEPITKPNIENMRKPIKSVNIANQLRFNTSTPLLPTSAENKETFDDSLQGKKPIGMRGRPNTSNTAQQKEGHLKNIDLLHPNTPGAKHSAQNSGISDFSLFESICNNSNTPALAAPATSPSFAASSGIFHGSQAPVIHRDSTSNPDIQRVSTSNNVHENQPPHLQKIISKVNTGTEKAIKIINQLFSKLEKNIGHLISLCQKGFTTVQNKWHTNTSSEGSITTVIGESTWFGAKAKPPVPVTDKMDDGGSITTRSSIASKTSQKTDSFTVPNVIPIYFGDEKIIFGR